MNKYVDRDRVETFPAAVAARQKLSQPALANCACYLRVKCKLGSYPPRPRVSGGRSVMTYRVD